MKDSATRLEAAKQSVRAMGGELKAFYLVMGRSDAVVIAEAPDDETATRFALATAARGFVRTETLRATRRRNTGASSLPCRESAWRRVCPA